MRRLLGALVGLFPAISTANVVISEVLFNEVGGDVAGEWIEIYNNGSAAVDLAGWHIGDEETQGGISDTETMMVFPAASTIGPGEVQIVAANAITFNTRYGFKPKYEGASGTAGDDPEVPNLTNDLTWDSDGGIINMSNMNDHVLLLNAASSPVDRVNWGNNGGLNPGLPDTEADGQSWFRINPLTDTDTAADWDLTPPAVNSTPGQVPGTVLFQAVLVDSPGGRLLRWTAKPGAATYRVQMSEDLAEWTDEALQLTATEWPLPSPLPSRVFFRVVAD